jgi:hypothetical protein
MPSSEASIDCGANAKATKFKMEPEMKITVPTIHTGLSQVSISASLCESPLASPFFLAAISSAAASSFSLISSWAIPKDCKLLPVHRRTEQPVQAFKRAFQS